MYKCLICEKPEVFIEFEIILFKNKYVCYECCCKMYKKYKSIKDNVSDGIKNED